MNTQKIVNKYRNDNQWFNFHITNNTIIFLTDFIQCFRGFIRCKGSKQVLHMTIRVSGTNVVLHTFRPACHRIIHVAIQNFMKLQDIILRNRNRIKAFVNNI